MPERLWPNGGSTTTPSGPTAVSVICRRPTTPRSAARHRNGTARCAQSGASRPIPLQHRAWQAQMTNRLYSSLDESRGAGQSGEIRSIRQPTQLGHFLRSTRIDALPQLVNVLRGEMTLFETSLFD